MAGILLACDDPTECSRLLRVLASGPRPVFGASSWATALALAEVERPDVLILDMRHDEIEIGERLEDLDKVVMPPPEVILLADGDTRFAPKGVHHVVARGERMDGLLFRAIEEAIASVPRKRSYSDEPPKASGVQGPAVIDLEAERKKRGGGGGAA